MNLKKIFAHVCNSCPFCILARRYPDSWFGKIMSWHGKYCPFWKAWEETYGKGNRRAGKGA